MGRETRVGVRAIAPEPAGVRRSRNYPSRLNIQIDEETLDRLRRAGSVARVSLALIVREALKVWLRRWEEQAGGRLGPTVGPAEEEIGRPGAA